MTSNEAFEQIAAVDLSTVANIATALTVLTGVVFGLIEMRRAPPHGRPSDLANDL